MSDFETFLSFFPEITPPITLTDESMDHISATNDALPFSLIDMFILKWEGKEIDEFTEYIPCFKFPKTEKFTCLVYWKASLLRYDFWIATIDDNIELVALKPLCGTTVEDDVIKKSVANIDKEYIIHIVAGAHKTKTVDYDGSYSQSFSMEIMANGEIVFMKED